QLLGMNVGDDEIRVGNEWYPYGRDFLIESSWLALVLVPLGFLPILLDLRPSSLRRVDGKVVALGIIAVTFLGLYLSSRRWVEAEPAFATIFCAFAWSRALPERVIAPFRDKVAPWRQTLLGVLCGLAVLPLLSMSIEHAQDDVSRTSDYGRFRGASNWLV